MEDEERMVNRWCLLFLLLLAAACSDGRGSWPKRTMPTGLRDDPQTLVAAAAMFKRNCAYCHGKVDEGRSPRPAYHPPAPDFTADSYRTVDPAYLYWRIETGKNVEPYRSRGSVMPAWGPYFSDRQIWQMVVFIQQRAVHDRPAP